MPYFFYAFESQVSFVLALVYLLHPEKKAAFRSGHLQRILSEYDINLVDPESHIVMRTTSSVNVKIISKNHPPLHAHIDNISNFEEYNNLINEQAMLSLKPVYNYIPIDFTVFPLIEYILPSGINARYGILRSIISESPEGVIRHFPQMYIKTEKYDEEKLDDILFEVLKRADKRSTTAAAPINLSNLDLFKPKLINVVPYNTKHKMLIKPKHHDRNSIDTYGEKVFNNSDFQAEAKRHMKSENAIKEVTVFTKYKNSLLYGIYVVFVGAAFYRSRMNKSDIIKKWASTIDEKKVFSTHGKIIGQDFYPSFISTKYNQIKVRYQSRQGRSSEELININALNKE